MPCSLRFSLKHENVEYTCEAIASHVSGQKGFVKWFFFLILKYIQRLNTARQKRDRNDRLVTIWTSILCRCFCVDESLLGFLSAPKFTMQRWMGANTKRTVVMYVLFVLYSFKPAGWISYMRQLKVVLSCVSHLCWHGIFSFSPNPRRCWKVLTWIKTKEYVMGRFLLCN